MVGRHAFDEGRLPVAGDRTWENITTFSIGIYPWVEAKGGKEKKGAVVVRISGKVGDADKVKKKAIEVMKLLDDGRYSSPKNIKVS